MAYQYRKPPAVAPPWWIEWRVVDLLLCLVFGLSFKACKAGAQYYAAYREQAAAAPYLEAANPWRRRAGLWPVTVALPLRGYDNDSVVRLSTRYDDSAHRYRPYAAEKYIVYSPASGRVWYEQETIEPGSPNGQATKVQLTRHYWPAVADRGGYPWRITLSDWRSGTTATRPLTWAQADSVLAYWKAQGVRDSLTAIRAPHE